MDDRATFPGLADHPGQRLPDGTDRGREILPLWNSALRFRSFMPATIQSRKLPSYSKPSRRNPPFGQAVSLSSPSGPLLFPQVARGCRRRRYRLGPFSAGKAEYAGELRKATRSPPIFSVSADQVEVGRIQARQIAALLPRGGAVLLIQGPGVSSVSRDRHTGTFRNCSPPHVHITSLQGRWTEESAHQRRSLPGSIWLPPRGCALI